MKKIGLILLSIVLLIVVFVQYRHFYQVGDMTFTVWKKWDGKCYITPYRYWGLTSPKEDYMRVSNIGCYTIYIDVDSTLIVASEYQSQDKAEIFLEKYKYLDYPTNLDSITEFGEKLHKLRRQLPYMTLSVREPYAVMSGRGR